MSVPKTHPAHNPQGPKIPLCSCGAHCPTHGTITLEDRMAAWQAGYDKGIIEGRLNKLSSELDIQALRDASDLLEYVRERTHRLLIGPNWATDDGEPLDGDEVDE